MANPGEWAAGSACEGMTLRDYFAAKAMKMLLGAKMDLSDMQSKAALAYQMADAMLTERAK